MNHVGQQAVHEHELWESVASAARDRVGQRQAAMVSDHGLSGDVQYHWSMDDATIAWSRGGGRCQPVRGGLFRDSLTEL
ncbi:hypothetical protein ABZ570_33505, partial [Micromonospora sp. NPDC007271]|uniref:hypothetical protein n=1 Tax=Micromonospora sp. NPDC007271 TaxID=3154587 RepID=UPI003408E656